LILCFSQVALGTQDFQVWDNPSISGTWNSVSWSNSTAGGPPLFGWTDVNSAMFSATGLAATGNYTVTLASSVIVQDLVYTGGNAGSTLTIGTGIGTTITAATSQMNVTIDAGTTMMVAPAIVETVPSSLVLTSGTLILTGANTYTGGTTITAGTLQIGNGGATGSIVGDVVDNGNLTFNRSGEVAFAGTISGSGSLTQMGSGLLNLTGPNTYMGGTLVTGGGSLEINAPTDAALGTGGITLEGGTIQTSLDGFASSRAIKLLPSGMLLNILASGDFRTATYSGIISGTGSLTIAGGGIVVLGGANTYSGGTTVTNATLMVSDDTNFGAQNIGITLFGAEIVSTVEGFFSPRPILLMDEGDFPNVLAAGDGTTGSFGGVISGTSSLHIGSDDGPEATGIVRLSAGNTYTGGTVVTAGATLSIGADSALGLAGTNITLQHGELLTTASFSTIRPITLQDSAFTNTLAAANGTTMTYLGVITGNGALRIGDGSNQGTVVFKGDNTYIGDISIFPFGVLSIDKNTELGDPGNVVKLFFGGELLTSVNFTTGRSISLDPPIVGPAIGIVNPAGPGGMNMLAAAVNTTATYTGLVFGTEGLGIGDLKGNSGTVVLTDVANSYTGGTVVQGGATLSVESDPILGDPSGRLTLRGGEFLTTGSAFTSARAITLGPGADTLAARNGSTATYTGVLSDGPTAGTLVIGDPAHPGTIILSGQNTYTGGTVLEAGTLLVNNAQALGLGNVAVNGGILAADPQPINVGGNYTQSAAGTLQLSIAGRAAGQFDTLNVVGNASLNGTLALIDLGFHPLAGDKLRLINAGGAVTSRFATFQNPFTSGAGFNTVDLVYARQSVTLEFLNLAIPLPPVIPLPPGTPEEPAVVATTDFASFAFTPNQTAAANLLDAVQLDPKAATLVSFLNTEPFENLPNDLRAISPEGLTAFYEISFSNANIQKLTLEGRLDDIHSGSSGFSSNMKVNGASLNNTPVPDGKSSKAVVEPVLQPTPENRWGVWVTGFGDFVNVDGDGNAKGYNFTTGGVSLGIDFRITDHLAVGAMGDYSHTWTSLNPGHIDVDSGRGGLYASWFDRGFYVNGAIYGGHNNYDSNRSGLGGAANGSTEGSEWSTFIGAGYDFHFGSLTVGPIASLQYTDVGIDEFSEKGSLAPLDVHSGSAESLRSDAGFRLFYQWQIGKMVLEPSLKAAWEHEYKYSALPITAGFAGVPGPSATFFGPSEGHDSAVVSAGVSLLFTPAISTYVNYDGQLGRGNYDSNAVTGGIRISF
jgi:outer membrane autotransporter protein